MPRHRSQNLGHSQASGQGLRRLGGHPALDFANTVDRDRPQPETLTDYLSWLAWCEDGGLITRAEARRLIAAAKAEPVAAAGQHREVMALRDLTVRFYSARVLRKKAADGDVAALNALLRKYTRSPELTPTGLGYVRHSADDESSLLGPMRHLLGLIASFLTSPDFCSVSMCMGERCGWFFVDRTPTRRRRWCSMAGCGNRAKAQLHYRLHRAKGKSPIAGSRNTVRSA